MGQVKRLYEEWLQHSHEVDEQEYLLWEQSRGEDWTVEFDEFISRLVLRGDALRDEMHMGQEGDE